VRASRARPLAAAGAQLPGAMLCRDGAAWQRQRQRQRQMARGAATSRPTCFTSSTIAWARPALVDRRSRLSVSSATVLTWAAARCGGRCVGG
jgi:hypothetical protein